METQNPITYLDTHVVLWLYDAHLDLIPPRIQSAIEQSELLISPIVTLELQYLFEIEKITVDGKTIVDDLVARIGLTVCHQTFAHVVVQALRESWTRDPFDRVVVAQARLRNAPIFTKDKLIHKHYALACWG